MGHPITVGRLRAELSRIELPMGLVVDRLFADGGPINVQTEPLAMELGQDVPVTATLLAEDVAAFLNKEAPGGLKDFVVAVRDGLLYVEATARVLIEVRAKAVCSLRIQEGKAVFVDLESVDVMGLSGKSMVQSQLDQINPILKVDDLPIQVRLDTVKADSDQIVLSGVASP